MIKLFDIANVQQDIKQIEVYDDFAVVIDIDDAMFIAIRPSEVGGDAVYSVPPVRGVTTNFLFKLTTPIVAHNIKQMEEANEFRVDLVLRNRTALLLERYFLVVDPRQGTADFTPMNIQNANTTIQLDYSQVTSIEFSD